MSVIKIHVNKNNEGEIICPSCGKEKTISASHHLLNKKAIKVRCTCGYSFSISLDYRRFYRKKVQMPAKLYVTGSLEPLSDVTITSLSVSGIGFETKSLHNIYVNSPFEIEFMLDDSSETVIREKIAIKRINGFSVGAEFTDQEKYNFELDFYLATGSLAL